MINADVINNLPFPRVLVVGDFILDRYVEGRVERISPEAPIQIFKVQKDRDIRLGGAANVVHNLITLGARVVALGVIGTDGGGQGIISLLKSLNTQDGKNRLDYRGIIRDKSHITPIKERMISRNQQVLRVDREYQSEGYVISGFIENKLLQSFSRAIKTVDAVIISDYDKGTLTKTLLKNIVRLCRKHQKAVLVGPKGSDFTKYRGATAVVPNRSEAEEATGLEITGRASSYKSAAQKIIRNLALDFTVITLGPDGLYLLDKKGYVAYVSPTEQRAVFDVTGAGDTVLATLGVAFASGLQPYDALHLANLAAGVVVSKVGTSTVSRAEIIRHYNLAPKSEVVVAGHKLKNQSWIQDIARDIRDSHKKIVFTNGCFDIIHPGHIKTLEFARAQGDVLMLGLNSDKSVRRLKGAGRPILNQSQRVQVLAALAMVDYIVIFNESTPLNLIKKIKPDILVKGADWDEGRIAGADVVRSYGGKIARVPLIPAISTSDIINKIRRI
jgi:D-beta-D-heptose 7-phosphate kinase/D-beta-D-heptose 1-phosphate adenosyltransferase